MSKKDFKYFLSKKEKKKFLNTNKTKIFILSHLKKINDNFSKHLSKTDKWNRIKFKNSWENIFHLSDLNIQRKKNYLTVNITQKGINMLSNELMQKNRIIKNEWLSKRSSYINRIITWNLQKAVKQNFSSLTFKSMLAVPLIIIEKNLEFTVILLFSNYS